MSKLHIVFSLSIDLYDKKNQPVDNIPIPIDINQPNPKVNSEKLEEYIMSEIQSYTFDWFRHIIVGGRLEAIAYGFNHVDDKYHMWVRNVDNNPVNSVDLSSVIHFATKDEGIWYKYANILNKNELNMLKLGSVKLVPTIEKVFVVNEQEVDINRLPPFK